MTATRRQKGATATFCLSEPSTFPIVIPSWARITLPVSRPIHYLGSDSPRKWNSLILAFSRREKARRTLGYRTGAL